MAGDPPCVCSGCGCSSCGCSGGQAFHTRALPQSYQPIIATPKKQWISYDESDADTQYGFQRKKRFGGKNGSSAVRHCLEWTMPITSRNGAAAEESDEEEQREGVTAARVGVRVAKEPTAKVGHGGVTRQCVCSNAFEMAQLKHALAAQQSALQRNEEVTQQLQAKIARLNAKQQGNRTHTCGCGCVTTNPTQQQHQQHQQSQQSSQPDSRRMAWQSIPLSQVLDGETGLARDLRSPGTQSAPVQNRSVESAQPTAAYQPPPPPQIINSARFSPDTVEPSNRPPIGFALPLSQIAQSNAAAQHSNDGALSARLSARASARKDNSTKAVHDPTRKLYSLQSGGGVISLDGGEGATHPPVNKQGLGNTMLGSPHDPRQLHDPESIDPVWRKREEARERAKRLNALFGASKSDKPIIDEKQYEASIMKQHARRLKIKSFEARFQEQRLNNPAPGSTTRDYSETWMSVVSGRPPFCAFGGGNTAPATGGVCYGNYMLSHNVSPEKYPNRPNQKQTTNEARRVKQMKSRENAKSLKRLQAAGEVPAGVEVPIVRPSTASRLKKSYDENGRSHVEVSAPQSNVNALHANGIPQVPLSQQQQNGNLRNVSSHFDAPGGVTSPAVSPSDLRLPIERALAWNTSNQLVESRRSGRKQGFDQEVIGGRNTLAETSARTMSVLPLPEPYPQQA